MFTERVLCNLTTREANAIEINITETKFVQNARLVFSEETPR
jgi:hypothetical protein